MKKLLKILAWAAALFLALLIVVIVAFKLFFPVDKAKELAVAQGSQLLGRPLKVRDVDISIWGGLGIKLNEVTIGSPKGMEVGNLLEADAVDLKLRIFPLLSGKFRMDRLIIDRPRIVMVKTAEGVNNYTFALAEKAAAKIPAEKLSPETKAAAAAVSFEHFNINDGNLTYRDDSAGISLELTGLNLSTSLKNPRDDLYESSGQLQIESLLVTTADKYPPQSMELSYEAEFDVAARALTLKEAELRVNRLSLALNGSLSFDGKAIKSQVDVASGTIDIKDLLSLLPERQRAELKDYSISGNCSLDANIAYDGSKAGPLTYSGTAVITDLVMSTADIDGELRFRKALLDFKPDNLRLNIEDGTFDGQPLKGHLVVNNFDDPTVAGALSGSCDLAYIKPFLPLEGKHELAGQADFDVKVAGPVKDPKAMNFSGTMIIENGRYNSELLPEPVELFSLDIFFDNTVTRINKLAVKTPSIALNFFGRISNLMSYVLADSSVSQSVSVPFVGRLEGTVNLGVLNPFLPPAGKPELKGLVTLNMELTGDAMAPVSVEPYGELSIRNASFTDSLLPEQVRAFEMSMRMVPDTLFIDQASVQFESSDAAFSGKLLDPFPFLMPVSWRKTANKNIIRKPTLVFKFTSRRFDIDRLFPEAVPGSGANRAALPRDSVPPLFFPDINGRGAFRFDTLIYSRIEFTQVKGSVRIYNRRIDCYDVTAKVYTGDIAGTTTIDLKNFSNPRYSGEFKATRIEADDFVSRFSRFGGHLFGKMNLSGNYQARGWEPDEFMRSLTVKAKADMSEGKVVTDGFLYSTLASLAKKMNRTFEREQPLKSFSTNIIVEDGKVRLDKLKTKVGKMGDLELDGYYSMTGDLEYKGSILLSKEWTSQLLSQGGLLGGLAGLFTDKSVERIKLPLVIGGTIDKPTAKIDFSALTQGAQNNLTKDAGNFLKNLLKKKDKK
jgi:uncharacterized protein involved in outer membrane biogenesis